MAQRPNILFVASREASYPRNENIIHALRRFSNLTVICFDDSKNQGSNQPASYLFRILRVLISLVKELVVNRKNYDVLIVGFFAQPIVPLVCLLWSGTLVVDVFISFYDTLCHDRKLFRSNSLVGRLALWFDKYAIEKSDLVLTDTDAHVSYLRTFTEVKDKQIKKLYIGAKMIPRGSVLPSDRPGTFTVIFAGAFTPLQGPQYVVEAARISSRLPIEFIMLGAGPLLKECRTLVNEYKLNNVHLLGWKSFHAVIQETRTASLALGVFGDREKTKRVIPNKVFGAVSLGTPVLTASTSAIRELFSPDYDILACELANPSDLAERLLWAFENQDKLSAIGLRGQQTLNASASGDSLSITLRTYITELLEIP